MICDSDEWVLFAKHKIISHAVFLEPKHSRAIQHHLQLPQQDNWSWEAPTQSLRVRKTASSGVYYTDSQNDSRNRTASLEPAHSPYRQWRGTAHLRRAPHEGLRIRRLLPEQWARSLKRHTARQLSRRAALWSAREQQGLQLLQVGCTAVRPEGTGGHRWGRVSPLIYFKYLRAIHTVASDCTAQL